MYINEIQGEILENISYSLKPPINQTFLSNSILERTLRMNQEACFILWPYLSLAILALRDSVACLSPNLSNVKEYIIIFTVK